jgi:hypothetical protein
MSRHTLGGPGLEFEPVDRKRHPGAQRGLLRDLMFQGGQYGLELSSGFDATAEACEVETLEMGGVRGNAARYPG